MKKLLIVDDNEQNLYMLQVLLSANGFQVEQALNGAEALECARRVPPDMIISDLLMPVMDGYTLLHYWKSDELLKTIPFVVYTATYTDAKDEHLARSLGADDFILKPTESEAFMARIQNVLAKAKKGELSPVREPASDKKALMNEYSEVLIRKLEEKALQLQHANRTLEEDIAERKKTDNELRHQTALLEAQLNSSIDGILIVDANGKKILQNRRTVELWKIPRDIADNIDDATQVRHVMHLTKFPEQFIEKITYLYSHPNETSRDEVDLTDGTILERYSAPVLGKDGQNYGRIWTFHDITKRKQYEKEREHLQAQLLQAQKMEAIGTLAGGVAHDFNNLLTAISGFTTMAMGKIDESDPIQRDLRQVSIAASKAAGLTRQLLLFSRKQHMEQLPMDPNATVSRLLKMLDRLIGEDIAIETDLEKDIWHILGDEGNIEQVLMNLSVNARDAMPQGGKLFIKTENVTIDEEYCRAYHAGRPGYFVCLSVSDTGTGMDQLTQEHIFEPFFTTKGEGKGTGLGLSVVLGIVQQHKGWINIYSEPGHGTTFKVYFPSSSAKAEQKGKEVAPLASLEGKGERIMVVEDQAEVRELAVEILTTNGYSAFPVSSAREAMELFEKENGKFDLVFSDVVLTDTTGILLVEGLLKRWKFKVIITSGYTDEKANWDFIKEKNFRFLHKPYAMRDLLQVVREVLDEKRKS